MRGTLRPAEAPGRFPRKRDSVIRSNANDEASGWQSPKKMCHRQKAASPHRPGSLSYSSHSHARPALPQMRGRIRDWSRDPQGAPTPPSPLPARHRVQAHAHPVASLAKSRAKPGAASPTATAAFRRTMFHIDSLRAQQKFEGSQFYSDGSELLKQSANVAKCRSELIGVICGWIFELLEEGVNGGADFGSIGRLCVLAISNIERIERHDYLFRSAFVGQSDSFRIVRDALQYPQDNCLIVSHGCQSLGDLLRQRRSRGRSRCHRVTIRIQLAHFIQNDHQLTIQFLRVRRVDLLCQQAEHRIARTVPRWIARTPPN